MLLSSDRPIEKAAQDRLGYAPFAHAIAASITRRAPVDGIVYAIHGAWGSGKTSAVNMLIESIKEIEKSEVDKAAIIVKFNPWWFSEQADLTRVFFSELASALDKKASKKIVDGLRKVGKKISGVADLVSAAVSLAPGGGVASPLVKSILEAVGAHQNDTESLDGVRQELIDALEQQQRRIIVIVDDVDRLPPDEIKQIFKLVKSVADLPNVVYILVFDRAVAKHALGESSSTDGPEWLEKIVQASFDLPPVHAVDLRKMLVEGINELIGDKDTGDSTRAANVMIDCVFPWIKTPRDVGRLLNALNVSIHAVMHDVNIMDFIAIETMRIFENRLYYFLRDNQDELTGVADSRSRDDAKIGDLILAQVALNRAERVQSALKRLFPRLEGVWDNSFYDSASAEVWSCERRICIKQFFPAYFSLAPGDDALRESEILQLLLSLTKLENFEKQIISLATQKRRNGTTKASLVFDIIRERSLDIPDSNLLEVCGTLLRSGHILHVYHDGGTGFASLPFTWNYWFSLHPVLKRVDKDKRAELLSSAFAESCDLGSLNFVLVAIEGEFGLHEGGEVLPPDRRLIQEGELNSLQSQLVDRIKSMACDGSLVFQPDLGHLLLRWSEMCGSEVVREWSGSLLADKNSAHLLAKTVMNRGSTHAQGDRVSKTYYHIDRKFASKLVDVDALAARLSEMGDEDADIGKTSELFRRALSAKDRWGVAVDD